MSTPSEAAIEPSVGLFRYWALATWSMRSASSGCALQRRIAAARLGASTPASRWTTAFRNAASVASTLTFGVRSLERLNVWLQAVSL